MGSVELEHDGNALAVAGDHPHTSQILCVEILSLPGCLDFASRRQRGKEKRTDLSGG